MADLDHEIRRGHEAERIMNEPLVKEAFATIEKTLLESLRKADLNKPDILRTIAMNIQVLQGFKKILQTTIDTGKMARIQNETLAQSILRKVKG